MRFKNPLLIIVIITFNFMMFDTFGMWSAMSGSAINLTGNITKQVVPEHVVESEIITEPVEDSGSHFKYALSIFLFILGYFYIIDKGLFDTILGINKKVQKKSTKPWYKRFWIWWKSLFEKGGK